MEVLGANNNNQIAFPIDKKVYYSFLNTPYDRVQISQKPSDEKQDSKKNNNEFKQVANIVDPRKNYKRVSTKIAGVAGASVLIGGLLLAAVLRGKSGSSEKLRTLLQKLRGQAYNLKTESSFSARTKCFISTKLTSLIEGGLNTWINTEQLKNMFLDKKVVQKFGIFKKPIYWSVDRFKGGAQWWTSKKYAYSIKNAKSLQELAPDLVNAVKQSDNFISGKEITKLNKQFPGLNLRNGETRAQVVEKLINKIAKDTESFGKDNFNIRQQTVDKRLGNLVDDYAQQFHILSEGNNGNDLVSSWTQAVNTLKTSKKGIISRGNQTAFEETRGEVYKAKDLISRNINDNYKRNMEILKEIETDILEASKGNKQVQVKYTTNYSNIIRVLEKQMKHYKESRTSAGLIARQGAIKSYKKQAASFIEAINKGAFSPEEKTRIIEKLNNSIRIINNNDQKGMIQELRDLLKCTDADGINVIKRDNNNLYTTFKNRTDKLSNSLSSAAKFESDNLFYRLMDLKLGGGDFEVIGLSLPIGMGMYHISKSDSHDEKVSKGIRTGAVIGGGMVGWVLSGVIFCLSAGNSILFGLGAGLICDKVGEFIDNKFWSKGRDWKTIHKQRKLEEKKALELQKQQAQALTA